MANKLHTVEELHRCGESSFGVANRYDCTNKTNMLVNLGEDPILSSFIHAPDKNIYVFCCANCLPKYDIEINELS